MSKRKDGQARGQYTLEYKLEAVRLVKGGQSIIAKKQFMAIRKVPIAEDDNLEDLTFEAASRKVKVAVQIAGSIFLSWWASVLRELTIAASQKFLPSFPELSLPLLV